MQCGEQIERAKVAFRKGGTIARCDDAVQKCPQWTDHTPKTWIPKQQDERFVGVWTPTGLSGCNT